MPKFKAPRKLYSSCIIALDQLLNIACFNIWFRYKSYNNEDTRSAINYIQQYLISSIPMLVLDDIFNAKKTCNNLSNVPSFVTSLGDIRILLSIVLHKHMTVFKLTNLDIPNTVISKVEDTFWMAHLSAMSNLVILDLSLACTDQVLEVVGNSCPLLEEVTVVSKMSRNLSGAKFNALAKIYLVTDNGLSFLTQCKNLRQISLNASNRSGLGNITEQGICNLIINLPHLKIINYEYMGSILNKLPISSSPLQLQQLKDLRCNPINVSIISHLCPNLLVLHVALPTNLPENERRIQSEALEIALSQSNLQVQILNQSFITINNSIFQTFLESKGEKLTILSFGLGCNKFDSNSLLLIGHSCPNLKDLSINSMGPDDCTVTYPKFNAIYNNLETLRLTGNTVWDVNNSLYICISSEQVTNVSLCGSCECLDQILTNLMDEGRLNNLKSLVLHRHCYITNYMVWQLLQRSRHLSKLYLIYHNQLSTEDSQTYLTYAHENNWDLDLKFSDGSHPWN